MKTIILTLVLFASGIMTNAQVVVNDPVNTALLNSILIESATSSALSADHLSLFSKIYQKASNAVKITSSINRIITQSKRTYQSINRVGKQIKSLENKVSARQLSLITSSLDNGLRQCENLVEDVLQILSSDASVGFKMSDYERYDILRKRLDELDDIFDETNKLSRELSQLDSSTQLLNEF